MLLSLTDFFIIASIIQGVSVGLAILCAPFFRSKTNNYLAAFILTLSGMTFLGWQELDLFWLDYTWSLMWEFLIPVFLFQYFLRVLDHRFLRASWLPYLYAFFLFFLVIDIVFDLDFAFNLYRLPIAEENSVYQFYDSLLDSMALWWNTFLCAWMFKIAWKDTSATVERRRWLLRFGIVMLAIMTIWFLSDLVHFRTQVEDAYAALWVSMSLLFWWIAYSGVYQLRILEERSEIHALLAGKEVVKHTSTVPPTDNVYNTRLRELMSEEHLYRNPDLGRQLIADHLGISEGYVTQVMHDALGMKLVDFVNSYRVAAAREMLSDEVFAPYSLEAIGREAGFKSRSAFYQAFKSATGQTPGSYRKQGKTS